MNRRIDANSWRPVHNVLARLLLAGFTVGALLVTSGGRAAAPIHVAIVGPMSGAEKEKGEAMVSGAQLYFEGVNEAGGIDGRMIEATVLDDRNERGLARKRAEQVAGDSRTLAVIGHRSSAASLAAGGVYERAGIPAITATATTPEVTKGNDWYFRVVFNNAQQGGFIAHYIHEVLGYERAAIIHDENDYGSSLAASFHESAERIGLDVTFSRSFDSGDHDHGQRLEHIVDELSLDAPGILFLAVKDAEGARLACLVRDRGLNSAMVGANSIGKQSFASDHSCGREEEPGGRHYSDGVYATSSLIFDVANHRAQRFRQAFKDRYGEEPDAPAAGYYDAAALIVHAIRETRADQRDLERARGKIRSWLGDRNGFESSFQGVTGDIYFTNDGDAVKAVPVGVYRQGKLISAPVQLQPVVDIERIKDDLDARLGRGEVLRIGGDYMFRTNIVYAGFDINEIDKIDSATSSYRVDFFLWFRYASSLDAADIEFINGLDTVSLGEPIAELSEDGMMYRAYRVKSAFWSEFNFEDYPFDSQVLGVRFRHRKLTRNELIYVIDEIGMRGSSMHASAYGDEANRLLDPGSAWKLDKLLFFQDTMTNRSTLGDPRFLDAPKGIDYSRFNAQVEVNRDALKYVVKKMLFIMVLSGVLYLTFFLPPEYIDARLAIGIGGLVVIPFLRLELAGELPGVGYLVAADYVYFLLYLLALAVILLCIASMSAINQGAEVRAKRLDLLGRFGYPVLLLTGVGTFGWFLWT